MMNIIYKLYELKYMLHKGHIWISKKQSNATSVCIVKKVVLHYKRHFLKSKICSQILISLFTL